MDHHDHGFESLKSQCVLRIIDTTLCVRVAEWIKSSLYDVVLFLAAVGIFGYFYALNIFTLQGAVGAATGG